MSLDIKIRQYDAFCVEMYDDFSLEVNVRLNNALLEIHTFKDEKWYSELLRFLGCGSGDFVFYGTVTLFTSGSYNVLSESEENEVRLQKKSINSKTVEMNVKFKGTTFTIETAIPNKAGRYKILSWISTRVQKSLTFVYGNEYVSLKKALKEAIVLENYERAAQIRDRIKDFPDGVTKEFRNYELNKAIKGEGYKYAAKVKNWLVLENATVGALADNTDWIQQDTLALEGSVSSIRCSRQRTY